MKRVIWLVALVLALGLCAGCATSTPDPDSLRRAQMGADAQEEALAEAPVEKTVEVVTQFTPVPEESEPGDVRSTALAPVAGDVPAGALPAPARANRLIIKNAELELTVEDTDVAIDRLTQIVDDVGGYIVSSRVWYEEHRETDYKYASLTLGVPVEEFETVMRRLRGIAFKVEDERAAGKDVTDEYVDLQSRLRNLEATRDRIRTFLEEADNVEEALKVNEELRKIENEIEVVQGRINYLFDRASFSTITALLSPLLPEAPAPTSTPTLTPTPTPEPWRASRVAADASETLTALLRVLAELVIWFTIVVLPFLLPLVLIFVGVQYYFKRQSGREEREQGATDDQV